MLQLLNQSILLSQDVTLGTCKLRNLLGKIFLQTCSSCPGMSQFSLGSICVGCRPLLRFLTPLALSFELLLASFEFLEVLCSILLCF